MSDDLDRLVDAQLAECRQAIRKLRRLEGLEDDDEATVRVPKPRDPSPLADIAHADPPVPHVYVDAVGRDGCKVTLETRR
jgi:hypothetical protein